MPAVPSQAQLRLWRHPLLRFKIHSVKKLLLSLDVPMPHDVLVYAGNNQLQQIFQPKTLFFCLLDPNFQQRQSSRE